MITLIIAEACILTLAWLMYMNGYYIVSSVFVGIATLGILIVKHNKEVSSEKAGYTKVKRW